MEKFGVTVHPNLILAEVKPEALTFVSSWGGNTYLKQGFDSVVLVYGSVPQSDLYDQLKAEGSVREVYLAGGAWVPRRLAEATRHGANIGLMI
jgi:hypothetical protein